MMNQKYSPRDHPIIRYPPKTLSKLIGEHLTQKRDFNKAAATHLLWNHTSAWVPPSPVNSPHMPQKTPKVEHLRFASDACTTHSLLILETYICIV